MRSRTSIPGRMSSTWRAPATRRRASTPDLFLPIQGGRALRVPGRDAGNLRDVVARLQLRAIAVEEAGNVSAIPEEEHDVGEVLRVLEADRVPELVDARQVDDRFAEEGVFFRDRGDVGAEAVGVGPD